MLLIGSLNLVDIAKVKNDVSSSLLTVKQYSISVQDPDFEENQQNLRTGDFHCQL